MPAPRFGGVGDMASSLVGVIDSNRMMELLASDGIGMILPRTALAFRCRGSDDGRETFIREVSGLIGNIFLMGWAGHLATKALGDHVNPYNPKGIPGRAWITAENLDAFGKIYLDEVKHAGSEAEARQNFIHKVLEGLKSDDKTFSIEGRLSCLEQLDEASRGEMLDKMIKAVPRKNQLNLDDCKNSLKKLIDLKGQVADPVKKEAYRLEREELRQKFLNAGWGKLSEDAKTKLADAYKLKSASQADSSARGTLPLDRMAHERVQQKEAEFRAAHRLTHVSDEDLEAVLKKNGFDRQKERIKERLSLSLTDLKYNAKEFQNSVDPEALRHNLTSTVDLRHTLRDGQTKIKLTSNRGILLTELKHFLEQYADRAAHEAGQVVPPGSPAWNGDVKHRIEASLMAEGHNGNPLKRLIPQVEDGLITASMKSRGAYTWLPMAFCIAAAGAFTFYNNYITMKKHSGKVFFPGEGMPPIEGAPKNPMQAGAHVTAPTTNGMYRNFGTFPNYPQFRNSQGGIIA